MLGLSRKQLSSYLYLAFCRAYNAMKMSSASGVSHEIVYIAFSPFTKIQNSASHSSVSQSMLVIMNFAISSILLSVF